MERKLSLVILAAGMGSRYGGLKQIDPVTEENDKIIDFSIYDALKANFKEVVFIIKKAIEKDFKEQVGDKIAKHIPVKYAYQEVDKVPSWYEVAKDRTKPWGTGHALLCAKDLVDNDFAIINADDYYGQNAFNLISTFNNELKDERLHFAMLGYHIKNTLSENGSVARGVCQMDENHYLKEINERKTIVKKGNGASFLNDDGKTWTDLKGDTLVSMNFFYFTKEIFSELENKFNDFLKTVKDPLKEEFYLPIFIGDLIKENKATVKVIETKDVWFGVTYQEDKPLVKAEFKKLKDNNLYPKNLW